MLAQDQHLVVQLTPGSAIQTFSQCFQWLRTMGEVKSIDMTTLGEIHCSYFDTNDAVRAFHKLQCHPGVKSCSWQSQCDVIMPLLPGMQPWQLWEQLATQCGEVTSMALKGNKVKVKFADAASVSLLRDLQHADLQVSGGFATQNIGHGSNNEYEVNQVSRTMDSTHAPMYWNQVTKGLHELDAADSKRNDLSAVQRSNHSAQYARSCPDSNYSAQYLTPEMLQDLNQQLTIQSQQFQPKDRTQQHMKGNQKFQVQPGQTVFENVTNSIPELYRQDLPIPSKGAAPFQQMPGTCSLSSLDDTLDASSFKIDVGAIAQGVDKRTTCMIRNIPNKCTQRSMIDIIDEQCPGVFFNFLYVPANMHNRGNVGYAFINFEQPKDIIPFYACFHGSSWVKLNSNKVCAVAYARLQGLEALKRHFSAMCGPDRRVQPIFRQRNSMMKPIQMAASFEASAAVAPQGDLECSAPESIFDAEGSERRRGNQMLQSRRFVSAPAGKPSSDYGAPQAPYSMVTGPVTEIPISFDRIADNIWEAEDESVMQPAMFDVSIQ
jgi:hypothetical protein